MRRDARVLLLWSDDKSANLGVQALFHGFKSIVHSVDPHAVVDSLSHASPVSADLLPTRRNLTISLLKKTRFRQMLTEYDVIFDVGEGDSFSDIYGSRRLSLLTLSKAVCALTGSRAILAPQTVGPFESNIGKLMGYVGMRLVSPSIYARDEVSAAYAQKLSGRVAQVTTDMAFAMSVPEVSSRRGLGLNVSGYLWDHHNPSIKDRYQFVVNSVIDWSRTNNMPVSLIPHVWNEGAKDDDVQVSKMIASRDGDVANIVLDTPDARDAKRMLGSCEVVVAGRMHAAIGAVGMGVPTVALAYSRKFSGVFNALDYNGVVELTAQDAPDLALNLLSRRDELRRRAERSRDMSDRKLEPLRRQLTSSLAK